MDGDLVFSCDIVFTCGLIYILGVVPTDLIGNRPDPSRCFAVLR